MSALEINRRVLTLVHGKDGSGGRYVAWDIAYARPVLLPREPVSRLIIGGFIALFAVSASVCAALVVGTNTDIGGDAIVAAILTGILLSLAVSAEYALCTKVRWQPRAVALPLQAGAIGGVLLGVGLLMSRFSDVFTWVGVQGLGTMIAGVLVAALWLPWFVVQTVVRSARLYKQLEQERPASRT